MNQNKSYLIEEWWTDWQIDIVKDSARIWVKKKFKAIPGFWIIKDGHKILGKIIENEPMPSDAIIDKNAWDHEHCQLCWEKISEYSNDQNEGYTDNKDWLCINCFNKYIGSQKNI